LDTERLDATFFALSDPTRREILLLLAKGEASVNELTERFSISQPAVSRHLKVLENAGLIRRSRAAQRRPATVEPQSMQDIAAWIDRYRKTWEQTYRRLDTALAQHLKGT
jgi:DNA-binding transcriptional ArsR family regulator